jgi:hypothetical protein
VNEGENLRFVRRLEQVVVFASLAKKQRLTNIRNCVEYAFLAAASQFNGPPGCFHSNQYSETAL